MITLRDKRYEQVKLTFVDEGHKYFDSLGNTYTSATTILGALHNKFDKKKWLKIKAKELGISEAELEKQWATITDEACTRGTRTHDGLENGIKGASKFKSAIQYLENRKEGEMITVADLARIDLNIKELSIKDFIELTDNRYAEIYNVLSWYVARGYHIYAEIGAFLIDFLVSGTIDVLLIRDDRHVIGDWKTNRGGLIFESGYFRKDKSSTPHQLTAEWVRKDEVLLPPVSNMPDCNGSIYNLQLSLYAYMVEVILGIPNAGMWLCHIDSDFVLNQYGQPKRFPDGLYRIKDNPVERTTFYKLPYRKKEIQLILEDRYKQVQARGVKKQFELFDNDEAV